MIRLNTIVLLIAAATSISVTPWVPRFNAPDGFVHAEGSRLMRNGRPFRFVGINCFELADYHADADAILRKLADHKVRVVRFWAFQSHCGPSGRDFSRFDAIVSAAKEHDILLLPVLENHWKHCTYDNHEPWKPPSWYARGWSEDRYGGAPLSYRDYIRALAEHFRNEPQILAWQLMNEPEIDPESPAHARTLRAFARDASREVRAVDPHHMISLGLLGLGQPSTAATYYIQLHQSPEITLVSAHDHGYWDDPMPGRGWNWFYNTAAADLADAGYLQKPFLVTEAGIPRDWMGYDLQKRAEKFRAKLLAFSQTQTAGYILWNYEPNLCTEYGFDPNDPIWDVLTEAAAWFDSPRQILESK
jgi:mannan endo-1,4-beta-mannosidase